MATKFFWVYIYRVETKIYELFGQIVAVERVYVTREMENIMVWEIAE